MILHIDMDAFFASVEQSSNPNLKNRPIAVTGSEKRSVIITSSYEARRFGVKTGMVIPEAKKVCPHLIIVIANFEKYASTSKKIMEIFKKYGVTEVFSVDEAFIDISNESPSYIATSIKSEIKRRFGITCSIGVGKNKTIAKLASGANKPDGYFVADSFDKIKDMPIDEVCGIGKKSSDKLRLLSINTIADFVNKEDHVLKKVMGIHGIRLKLALLGELSEPVNPKQPAPKSVSNSMTLPHDIWSWNDIQRAIFQLSEKVAFRLRCYNLWGKKVSLYVRYKDFEGFCIDKKYYQYTNDEQEIYQRALDLLKTVRLTKPIRLLSVSVTELAPAKQLSIFGQKNTNRLEAIDSIRRKWGFNAVTWGILLNKYEHKPPISPAWRPERY